MLSLFSASSALCVSPAAHPIIRTTMSVPSMPIIMAEDDDVVIRTLGDSSKDSALRNAGTFEKRTCIVEQQRAFESRLGPQRNIQEIVAEFEEHQRAVAEAKAAKLAKMRSK